MIQPITGLTSLGNAIADAGQTYAQNARQDEIDSRNRARVLEDVQSQRAYDAARENRVADLQFDQERRMANAQMEQAFRKEMIARGYLDYSDRANEGAVAVAHENFKRDGLLSKFDKAISRGLIQVADVGDRAKTDAGLQAMANQDARLLTEDVEAKRRTRQGGQAAAERALQSETELNAQIDRLSAELRAPVAPVTSAEISARAKVLWLVNHPNEVTAPTAPNKLAREIDQATKELRDARYLEAKEHHDQVQQELYLLRQQIVAQTQESGRLGQQGFFSQPTVSNPSPSPRVLNSPLNVGQSFKSGGIELIGPALEEMIRRQPPVKSVAAPGIPGLRILDNPTNDAVVARGNQAIEKVRTEKLHGLLNDAIREGEMITSSLSDAASVTGAPSASQAMYASEGPWVAGAAPGGPISAGQQASDLLKRDAENNAKVQKLRSLLQDAGAGVTPPRINTSVFTAPVSNFGVHDPFASSSAQWWKANQP